jgi:hypothetical protein
MTATDRELGELSVAIENLAARVRENSVENREGLERLRREINDRFDAHEVRLESGDKKFQAIEKRALVEATQRSIAEKWGNRLISALWLAAGFVTGMSHEWFALLEAWLSPPPKH